MKQIENHSKLAAASLNRIDAKTWSKAFISTVPKADNIENNMSECFNSWIINERYLHPSAFIVLLIFLHLYSNLNNLKKFKRYLHLLDMIQEIHFKLLRRVTEKRGEIRDSNWDICPKIKKILDANIMQSRKWRAVWDGESKYQVKYNTRFVTVDLDSRSCDCRNFDLTGIPCSHALAAIYDRRGQPVDYLSDYYKRDKYAAAYAFPLTALKGVDYWDFHDDEVLLPPELPKKLRGRPKRLRRREEWEGGTQGKAKVTEEQVQRWSSKRVHHCSKCKKPGHRKPKCPELMAVGEQEQGDTAATEGGQQQESRTEFAGHEQDVGIGEEQDFGMGEDIGGHEETARTATKLMDQADDLQV